MGKNKLRKFAEMENLSMVFQYPYGVLRDKGFAMRGHWHEEFFGNGNPITVELGCGKGEYAVGLARRFPERNFIGIDIKGARMWTGAKSAAADHARHRGVAENRADSNGHANQNGGSCLHQQHLPYNRKRICAHTLRSLHHAVIHFLDGRFYHTPDEGRRRNGKRHDGRRRSCGFSHDRPCQRHHQNQQDQKRDASQNVGQHIQCLIHHGIRPDPRLIRHGKGNAYGKPEQIPEQS